MARGEAVRLLRGGEVSRSVEQVRDLFSSLSQVRKVRGLSQPMAFNGSCSGGERDLRPLFLPEPGEEGLGSRRFLRLR